MYSRNLMNTDGLKLRQNVPGQKFKDLNRSQNNFLFEHEVMSEKSDVKNLLSMAFERFDVESEGLDGALESYEGDVLFIGSQILDDFQELFHVVAINDKGNSDIFRFNFCLSLFVLVIQLRYEGWEFVVNVDNDHVDDFFQDSV
jgi:hypothetical protein